MQEGIIVAAVIAVLYTAAEIIFEISQLANLY